MRAGFQEDVPLTSCQPSEILVFVVALPMSKTEFIASEDKYIQSIATTARISRGGVKILRVDEIPSTRMMALRLLLAAAIRVETSVTLANGQPTDIQNLTVLNANLYSNGLPRGALVVQSPQTTTSSPLGSQAVNLNTLDSQANKTTAPNLGITGSGTPQPDNSASGDPGLTMGGIIGIVVGAGAVLTFLGAFFRYRFLKQQNKQTVKPEQQNINAEFVSQMRSPSERKMDPQVIQSLPVLSFVLPVCCSVWLC
jgi:hypothetical protein